MVAANWGDTVADRGSMEPLFNQDERVRIRPISSYRRRDRAQQAENGICFVEVGNDVRRPGIAQPPGLFAIPDA
jgi:hypothetical protein